MNSHSYQLLANAVLVAHAGVVLFIVAGLVLILLGGRFGWRWVHNVRFRALHLLAIVCVVAEAWLDIVCPLTSLEQWLRERAGQPAHGGHFIAFWLGRLLFFEAPPWVFIASYSLFALVVIASWLIVPPRSMKRRSH